MPLPMKSGCWVLMYQSAFDASMDIQQALSIIGSVSRFSVSAWILERRRVEFQAFGLIILCMGSGASFLAA